jgi:hypothetical protein
VGRGPDGVDDQGVDGKHGDREPAAERHREPSAERHGADRDRAREPDVERHGRPATERGAERDRERCPDHEPEAGRLAGPGAPPASILRDEMDPKHTPKIDPEAMARTLDPARVERDRKAALEALNRPTPATFDFGRKPQTETASPWAKGGAPGEIDTEALPSALVSAAEERPVTKEAGPARTWPRTWKLVAVAAMVALAAPLLVVLAGRPRRRHQGRARRRCPAWRW